MSNKAIPKVLYSEKYVCTCVVRHFMSVIQKLFIFLAATFLYCCKQDKKSITDHIEYRTGSFSVEEETVEPPPPDIVSKHKTLETWLTAICKTEKPVKGGLDYGFGLFESPDVYTIYLVGKKAYQKSQNEAVVRIEFEPNDMFFNLPKQDCEGLTSEQIRKRLFDQLVAFSKSAVFQNSFFSKASSMSAEWQSDPIWINK